MEISELLSKELTLCIQQDFSLSKEEIEPSIQLTQLREKLAKVIRNLIDKDFNKLLSIFYRIDLNESKVAEILSSTAPDEISIQLASLVIDRELQKAETRLRYKSL